MPMDLQLTGELPSQELGRVIDAFADAFSPLTETMGLLGDKVRVLRQDTAAAMVSTAMQKIEDSGRPKRSISQRQFARIVEESSYEEPGSPLIDVWSNLLANSVVSETEVPLLYTHILSHMRSSQASLLEAMVSSDRDLAGEGADRYEETPDRVQESWLARTWLSAVQDDAPQDLESVREIMRAGLVEMHERVRGPGRYFEGLRIDFLWANTTAVREVFNPEHDFIVDRTDIDVLISHNLLADRTFSSYRCKDDVRGTTENALSAGILVVTELGKQFYAACSKAP